MRKKIKKTIINKKYLKKASEGKKKGGVTKSYEIEKERMKESSEEGRRKVRYTKESEREMKKKEKTKQREERGREREKK